MTGPHRYVTEPGALDDIPILAVLKPHPATGTEARVCGDIARRQRLGLHKYGTTVEANPLPLRAWLQHAYEEALDQAIYLRRAIEDIERTTDQPTTGTPE